MHIQSADQAGLYATAGDAQKELTEAFPGANVQTFPSIELAEPELRVSMVVVASPEGSALRKWWWRGAGSPPGIDGLRRRCPSKF